MEIMQKNIKEIQVPELNRPYKYRLKTEKIDRTGKIFPNKYSWIRNVEIYHTGILEDLFRFQILCFHIGYEPKTSEPTYHLEKNTAYVFDDIRLSVNNRGEIVKLNNSKALQERWYSERKRFEKINKGDSVQNYFNFIERMVQDEQKMLDYLSAYEIYGMFFNGTVFGNLTTEIKREVKNLEVSEGMITENWKKKNTMGTDKIFTLSGASISGKTAENLLEKYEGNFIYENCQLSDGYMEIITKDCQTKYSILWVG